MQGWRNTQEDSHICALDIEGGGCVFAVFDGHGGKIEDNFKLLQYRK